MIDTSPYTPPEVWVWEKGDSPNWRHDAGDFATKTQDKIAS